MKKAMKRASLVLLALVMVLTMFGCGSRDGEAKFEAGTYTGTGEGIHGDIVVSVTVDENEILSMEVTEQSETQGLGDTAIEKIVQDILDSQSLAVDAVSGATYSSNGTLAAVTDALTQAGADIDALMEKSDGGDSAEAIVKDADVIVVGTGGAGMTAALEAARAGSSVIIIDKMSFVGGNTLVAGSAMNAPEPEEQKKQEMDDVRMATIEKILALDPVDDYMARWQATVAADMEEYNANGETYLYDSTDWFKLQIYVGGDYVGNPVLIELLAENSLASVKWMEEAGTIWKDDIVSVYGSTWTRGHNPTLDWGTAGAGFVLPQQARLEELGGEVLLGYKAEHILMEDGRVTAVTGTTNDGAPFTLNAAKGIVLATGGFGANVEMREEYNTEWPSLLNQKTTNPASSTGDGIAMGKELGANLVGMEWIQLIPYSHKALTATIDGCVMLNKDGERFVPEDERRDVIAAAALETSDQKMYWLYDKKTIIDELHGTSIYGEDIATEFPDGETAFYADSIEEIAKQSGIPYETLKKTIDDYNAAVDSGVDAIGRENLKMKIDEAPFALITNEIMVHHTMGGLEINTDAQVLDADGNIIEGLYAAGEVTGGIHGSNRLGGNAITDIVTYGRIAGINVSK